MTWEPSSSSYIQVFTKWNTQSFSTYPSVHNYELYLVYSVYFHDETTLPKRAPPVNASRPPSCIESDSIRIRPLATHVSAALKIPINSFPCQLGCHVSIAGMILVFVYTIIACLFDFLWKFLSEYRLSEHHIRNPGDWCRIKLSADVN